MRNQTIITFPRLNPFLLPWTGICLSNSSAIFICCICANNRGISSTRSVSIFNVSFMLGVYYNFEISSRNERTVSKFSFHGSKFLRRTISLPVFILESIPEEVLFFEDIKGTNRGRIGQIENNLKCIQQTTRQGAVLTFGRPCKKVLILVSRVGTRYSKAREFLFVTRGSIRIDRLYFIAASV